jgi:hypothetical protein
VHLAAHLETRALLDTNQTARYQQPAGSRIPRCNIITMGSADGRNIDIPGSPPWLRLAGRAKFLSSLTLVG